MAESNSSSVRCRSTSRRPTQLTMIASEQSRPVFLNASLPAVAAPATIVPGTVDVVVTTDGGTSAATESGDNFLYEAPVPTITSVDPVVGAEDGETVVTIEGTGFVVGASVAFGATDGTDVDVISSTELTVVAPAHALGTVDVEITTGGGTSPSTAGTGVVGLVDFFAMRRLLRRSR